MVWASPQTKTTQSSPPVRRLAEDPEYEPPRDLPGPHHAAVQPHQRLGLRRPQRPGEAHACAVDAREEGQLEPRVQEGQGEEEHVGGPEETKITKFFFEIFTSKILFA